MTESKPNDYTLDAYMSGEDTNAFWGLEGGLAMDLLCEAIERIGDLKAENARLREDKKRLMLDNASWESTCQQIQGKLGRESWELRKAIRDMMSHVGAVSAEDGCRLVIQCGKDVLRNDEEA